MNPVRMLFTICVLCIVGMVAAQNRSAPAPQTINLYGTLLDKESCPVYDSSLNVVLSFNNQKLAETRPDSNGKYSLTATIYGGIHEANVEVYHKGGLLYNKEDVSFTDTQNPLNILLPMYGKRFVYSYHRCGIHSHTINRPFRSPYGTIYYKPNYYDPVIYHNKITQAVTVTDKKGRPVAGVRVSLKVVDDPVPRSGVTDENGQLTLHMQFDRGALRARVALEADGYKPLRQKQQSLDVYTRSTYRLKKAR